MIVNDIDKPVDLEICACLNLESPRSFFLFAGAGSGKTRSLVSALEHIQKNLTSSLKFRGQKVSVITFTNAACEEIQRRLKFDPLIDVRTIHSFAWSLIEGLNNDIRGFLRTELRDDIEELKILEAKGRKGTKASIERLQKIESKTKRLANIDNIKTFTYSPTGDNHDKDSLSHPEVLKLLTHFLQSKPAMRQILIGRYPILLIDESQDTNEHLIDALFTVQKEHEDKFILGLLGDMMQRIYNDGKEGLGTNLPDSWAKPRKQLNHRCPQRVIKLLNKIRSFVDTEEQRPRSDAIEGTVRLFILPDNLENKRQAEAAISSYMAKATQDAQWEDSKAVKTLTLEHRMAASRMGFQDMFVPLYAIGSWRTSFLEGKLPASAFFTDQVLPLIKAENSGDKFAVARILKSLSPLLASATLAFAADKQKHLKEVRSALDGLMLLWTDGKDPNLLQVLQYINQANLLELPRSLRFNLERQIRQKDAVQADDDRQSEQADAIDAFLQAPFSQLEPFSLYINGTAHFDTHQGVKGLQFERVMVIMDDNEARGFNFKYEDLFGGKAEGEKIVENTRRLFYVTCSRAEKSLALVAYTNAPERIRRFVTAKAWFEDHEVLVGIPQ